MDLVQQLAEARRVPRKVSSDTPPAEPAFGLLGYATNTMRSPWEADLQWGESTPAPSSSLSKAYRWEETHADLGERDRYAADATSPILALTWTPSKFSSPTPSGAFTPTAARGVMSETEAMPGSLSSWSSSPLSDLRHAPFPSTAEGFSSLAQAQVESAQLATTPLSQLLVGRHVTDTQSFMSTPFPAGVQALVAGVPSTASTSGPSSFLTGSAQANHQALRWGNSLVEVGGLTAYVAGDATSPLPSMLTPAPADFEEAMLDVPCSTVTIARASRLTLTPTAQARNQAMSWGKSRADFRAQGYLAGDHTSPLPSTLNSSWSPFNFLAPTPLGTITTEDTMPVMETPPPPVGADAVLKDNSSSTQTPARLSGLTLTAKAKNQAEISATASADKARTPLGNVTNVLDSQVNSGRYSATPTRFTFKQGLHSILKAAVPSPLKPAESQPSPSLSLGHPQTQKFLSRESPSGASPGTPPNADLASPAPAQLRRSPAVVAMQPGFLHMLLCPTPTPALVRVTPKLVASASHVAQTQVASQAAGQPPVVVTTTPRPHAELSSTKSNTSSSRCCSKTSSQTSPATRKASQSPTSCLGPPWCIAGPNRPAVSPTSLAPAVNTSTAAAASSTQAQQFATRTGMTTRARASGPANVAPSTANAVRTASQPATAASTGVTTRARASGRASATPSSTQAVRATSQAVTAASTARTGSTGRAASSTIAEASSRAGQRAKQAAAQVGTSHSAGGNSGLNRRSARRQALLTAVASNDKLSLGSGAKQSTASVTSAKQLAANVTSAKHSAAIKAKQSTASVTSGAVNRPASGTTVAGRPRAVGKTMALKAEVPTRVQPTRASRKGWR
ncbi:hypothetical protein ABBQ38_000169 [Trebouxia sp. C0009 RCD-2024]